MKFSLPIFFSAALLSGAFFLTGIAQTITLVALMLLTPLFDKRWHLESLFNLGNVYVYILLIDLSLILIFMHDVEKSILINQFMFVAIPEEFFFRAYLMRVLGMNNKANVVVSVLFSLLHVFTRGWFIGLAVFVPSLLFGVIYQKYRDVLMVTLIHFLANIFFLTVLIEGWSRFVIS